MTDGATGRNFITDIIDEHNESGRFDGVVQTRFPPEPNGYLHIGHAKSICLNFGIAEQYGGFCNLRFDDTNPAKEEQEYIDAITEDVRWLGYDWGDRLYFASDYFDELYEMAVDLIRIGRAYVDELSPDEIRAHRGTLTEPGVDSPYRNRPIEENLALFEKMRAGGFKEGEAVLRAKIDMKSGNINLRDPVMYRILNAAHPRTGDKMDRSTRCTTSPTANRIPLRASPTPFARWNTKTTARSTTGIWTISRSSIPSRSSSRV